MIAKVTSSITSLNEKDLDKVLTAYRAHKRFILHRKCALIHYKHL